MSRAKLWIFTELFYPVDTSTGHIMTKVSKFLSNYFDVEVVTGPANYDSLTFHEFDNQTFSFKINRLKATSFSKNNLLFRSIRLILISAMFGFFAIGRAKSHEKVLIVTNPAFLVPLMAVLKVIINFKLYILVHDVFPENLVAADMIGSKSVIYRFLRRFYNWAYSKSDHLIVLDSDMQQIMVAKSKFSKNRVHVIQNWADLSTIVPEVAAKNKIAIEYDLQSKIVIVFAGNLGRLQGINELIQIIREVENCNLHFLFIGDGVFSDKVRKLDRDLSSVNYLGRLPRERQNEFLNAGSIHFVSINEKMKGLGVPSKSYNILAAGKPILFIGNVDTEIALTVKNNRLGWVFSPSEHAKILSFLNSLTKNNDFLQEKARVRIREYAESNFSENVLLKKIKEVIEE